MGFAGFEDDGGVGFFKEKEAGYCVEGTDDGEDPEDPAPAYVLHYYATEQGT